MSSCGAGRPESSSENAAAPLSRYKLDQVTAGPTRATRFHPADGVDCSQIANLISFAKNVQTRQTG